MYKAACPGCGADVAFKSAASVLSVCEYCQTTVLRTDDGVRDIGKRAALFEDYSPLKVGTAGVFETHAFTVIGRIQMRYEAGFWSEWYVLFDDNTGGWLSDASGQYTILRDDGPYSAAPSFDNIEPGSAHSYKGADYYAADVRGAQAAGFEGELPFNPGQGWSARVADFRRADRFLTLDYSDGVVPLAFEGRTVKLAELKLQMLRDDDTIKRTSGRLAAPVKNVPCPNCGSTLTYVEGIAAFMHCGSCGSEVSTTAETAEVLAKHTLMRTPPLTLEPGDEGMLLGVKWLLLGAVTRKELEAGGEKWTEYLLHNANKGFLWLVETSDSWSMTEVLDVWPTMPDDKIAVLGKDRYKLQYTYDAEVTYVVGAFNWRAKVGDKTTIISYTDGRVTLDAEASDTEFTWSRSGDIATDTVLKAFGRKTNAEATSAAEYSTSESDASFLIVAQVIATCVLALDLLFALVTGRSLFGPMVGLALTWAPFANQGVRDFLDL